MYFGLQVDRGGAIRRSLRLINLFSATQILFNKICIVFFFRFIQSHSLYKDSHVSIMMSYVTFQLTANFNPLKITYSTTTHYLLSRASLVRSQKLPLWTSWGWTSQEVPMYDEHPGLHMWEFPVPPGVLHRVDKLKDFVILQQLRRTRTRIRWHKQQSKKYITNRITVD